MKLETLEFLFDTSVLDENLWIERAKELYESAEVLRLNLSVGESTDRSINATFLMLVSYSIENYLKAILINLNKKVFRDHVNQRHELPKALKSHDLTILASDSGISTSNDPFECQLLKRLTYCAVWHGRYPVPLKARDFEQRIGDFFSSTDIPVIQGLIKKIKIKIRDLYQDTEPAKQIQIKKANTLYSG